MNKPESLPLHGLAPVIAASELDALCAQSLTAADRLISQLRSQLQARLDAQPDDAINREQARAHGFAWAATYVRALHEMLGCCLLSTSDAAGE